MKALRNQLGFTQQQFAALMGVSRTVVTMYEKGQRNLSGKAALKLAQMQLMLLQNKQRSAQAHIRLINREQEEYYKTEKILKAHARKAAAHALRITMELGNMQERYTKLSQKLAFLQLLILEATPATRQMSLLQNLEINVLDAMRRCAPPRQLIVEYRLQTSQARQQAATGVVNRIQQMTAPVKNL